MKNFGCERVDKRFLGHGAHGVVYLARHLKSAAARPPRVAIKEITVLDNAMWVSEVNSFFKVHSIPHTVRFIEAFLDLVSQRGSLVFEYCEGGDLLSLVQASPALEEPFIRLVDSAVDGSLAN